LARQVAGSQGMNVEINRECARLESLLHSRPNETARKEVEVALRSKWEGVQVWAGRVLAAWGGRRSVDALRGWLEVSLSKEAGWAIRGEAIRSLCQCYEPRDVPWLLDMYFSAADRLLRHEFSPVILALPEDVVRERIALEAGSQIETRREAATVATRMLDSWKRAVRHRSREGRHPTSHRESGLTQKKRSRTPRR